MTDTHPQRYDIKTLLETGIQPFPDLDDAEMKALKAGIGRTSDLPVPAVLTRDHILIDGHQRLRAMLKSGRKEIHIKDVRIMEEVDETNALEWAVRLNTQRRHLTVEDKRTAALELRAKYRWSLALIGRAMGVSRQAVSQWLEGEDISGPVVGEDGKSYEAPTAMPKTKVKVPKPVDNPWSHPSGKAFTTLHQAVRRLQGGEWKPDSANLTTDEYDAARTILGDMEFICRLILGEEDEPTGAPFPDQDFDEDVPVEAVPQPTRRKRVRSAPIDDEPEPLSAEWRENLRSRHQ